MDAPNPPPRNTPTPKRVLATTDGSCETQTGEGGWAYHLSFARFERTASGYEAATTNNRMELTAAVRALEALTEPCEVTIVTDSQYLKKAFTDGWLANWQRNGWRTASKQPVKNRDLWERLLELTGTHRVQWTWTKGHAGHARNEEVDDLALQARRERRGRAHG
ncbi:MAG: ribonuclease HI [Trueperaceae bacterium]